MLKTRYYFITYNGAMKVFLFMCCLLYAVEGYTFADKTKLHKDLSTNYAKKLRPGENQTELNFSFYMRSLNDFPGRNEKMDVVGSLGVEWKDVRFAWNPSDYGGDLNQTSVFVDDIWTPYLVLMNPFEEIRPILSGGFSCKVWYNGNVSCLPPPNIFEASCNANILAYPYDKKTCSLQLYVSGYYSEDLKLKTKSSTINTDMYTYHGMWNVLGTRIFIHNQYVDNNFVEILQLEITMQRLPGEFVLHYSPIFVLSVMKVFVFRLPDESGERVGFSLTILLAEMVFMTLTQENVPKSPNSNFSVLAFKQFIDIFTSFIILLGVIAASISYDEERTKEPKKIEEPKKTEETPGKLNVQTKGKKLSGKCFNKFYSIVGMYQCSFLNFIIICSLGRDRVYHRNSRKPTEGFIGLIYQF